MSSSPPSEEIRYKPRRSFAVAAVLLALGIACWLAWWLPDDQAPGNQAFAAPLATATPTLAPGTGAVVGIAWQDTNANGVQDPGELPLPSVGITLSNQAEKPLATATTGADGSYRFGGLQPGIYHLSATPPTGFVLTTPPSPGLVISAGAVLIQDFGALFVPTPTPTETPLPALDIDNAIYATCGSTNQGDTRTGANHVSHYGCQPYWDETGPETVYRIELGRNQLLSAAFVTTTADLDLFLLPSGNPDACLVAGDNALSYEASPGIYFLAVDGYQGAAGNFIMQLSCPLNPQATATPTLTPSPTPTETSTWTPGPTATSTATPQPAHSYLPLVLRQIDQPWAKVYNSPSVFWRDVEFVDRQTGYVLGGPGWSDNGNATVIRTTDGGLSWQAQVLPTQSWMAGLACNGSGACWAGGRYGTIMRTIDSGQTWHSVNNAGYLGFLVSARWTGIGNTVLMGGSHSNILRTSDGYNFVQISAPDDGDQNDFSCPAAKTCFSAASNASVFRTTDNGVTWVRRSAGELGSTYNGISCVDASRCWIAGSGGRIYYTGDAGLTWQRQQLDIDSAVAFNRIRMLDAAGGYAVGEKGIVYRTDDGQNWRHLEGFTTGDLMDLQVFAMNDVFAIDWNGAVWHTR